MIPTVLKRFRNAASEVRTASTRTTSRGPMPENSSGSTTLPTGMPSSSTDRSTSFSSIRAVSAVRKRFSPATFDRTAVTLPCVSFSSSTSLS